MCLSPHPERAGWPPPRSSGGACVPAGRPGAFLSTEGQKGRTDSIAGQEAGGMPEARLAQRGSVPGGAAREGAGKPAVWAGVTQAREDFHSHTFS